MESIWMQKYTYYMFKDAQKLKICLCFLSYGLNCINTALIFSLNQISLLDFNQSFTLHFYLCFPYIASPVESFLWPISKWMPL